MSVCASACVQYPEKYYVLVLLFACSSLPGTAILVCVCVCAQVPVRLREVVYTLSPFEQTVMSGLFKDLSYTVRTHTLSPLRVRTCVCAAAICTYERERELLTHTERKTYTVTYVCGCMCTRVPGFV